METKLRILESHAFSRLFMKIKLITLAQKTQAQTKTGALLRLIPMEFAFMESGDIARQIAKFTSNMVLKPIVIDFMICQENL